MTGRRGSRSEAATPDDEGFEQRPNVRWENDFGPDTPMWQHYLMAAACMAAVLGFPAVTIFLLGDARQEGAAPALDAGGVAAFLAVLALLLAIALRGERRAIRIRRFFERRPGDAPD